MVVMAPVVVAAQQSTSVTIGGTVRDHGADLYLPDVLVQLVRNEQGIAQAVTRVLGVEPARLRSEEMGRDPHRPSPAPEIRQRVHV